MGKLHYLIGYVIGVALVAAAVLAVGSLILMLIWNWLMPELFFLPRIRFLEAAGLLLLSALLFRSGGVSRIPYKLPRKK